MMIFSDWIEGLFWQFEPLLTICSNVKSILVKKKKSWKKKKLKKNFLLILKKCWRQQKKKFKFFKEDILLDNLIGFQKIYTYRV